MTISDDEIQYNPDLIGIVEKNAVSPPTEESFMTRRIDLQSARRSLNMRTKLFRNSMTVGENTSKAYFDRTFSTMTPNMNQEKTMTNVYGSM